MHVVASVRLLQEARKLAGLAGLAQAIATDTAFLDVAARTSLAVRTMSEVQLDQTNLTA